MTEKIAIAPMLDWTDKNYRYFMRQISQHTTLYTEMIVADAIIHGERDKLLSFNFEEQPVVLQLGGSNPTKLFNAAKIAKEYGYTEMNLNCGCPSDKVQSGSFGACLMQEANLVADCVKSLQDATGEEITIKHRIGLDRNEDYKQVYDFVDTVHNKGGCNKFIVHARNAILQGLSPKQNREIPPLRYDIVYQLKKDFPHLNIMINGGIKTLDDINTHLMHVNSVMLGREAYYNPYLFANVDNLYYNENNPIKTRSEIATSMIPYLENIANSGGKLHHTTRHMIGLYHGCKRAKLWRQVLTTKIIQSNSIDEYKELVDYMVE